jgi:hypothetical protein
MYHALHEGNLKITKFDVEMVKKLVPQWKDWKELVEEAEKKQ